MSGGVGAQAPDPEEMAHRQRLWDAGRSIKKVMAKNVIERSACVKQQRSLDIQRRNLHAHLCKEERELRAQLQRLQLEQRRLENVDGEPGSVNKATNGGGSSFTWNCFRIIPSLITLTFNSVFHVPN